jgi:uncharacterized protein (DUF58 family)
MGNKLNVDYISAIAELRAVLGKYIPRRMYMKIFRGKGLEFDRYRKYDPNDDARLIDWKASLRTNQILSRQYIEERDLKILFVVDVGENMVFGSTNKLKCEYTAEVSAALMHLILNYNDNFGLLLFNSGIKKYVKPDKGYNQFRLLTDFLSDSKNYGGLPNFENLIDYLLKSANDIDCIFLLSDFLYFNDKLKEKASVLAEKFELISIMVRDPLDISLPEKKVEVLVEDSKTGNQVTINPSRIKKQYEKHALKQIEDVKSVFQGTKSDFLQLKTSEGFALNLAAFLRERAGKEQKVHFRG